jgi:hypothetical protein
MFDVPVMYFGGFVFHRFINLSCESVLVTIWGQASSRDPARAAIK